MALGAVCLSGLRRASVAIVSSACLAVGAAPGDIPRVKEMPNLPQPYLLRDWKQVTRGYLEFVFDFDKRGPYLPLVRWEDKGRTVVGMPAYVGAKGATESINYLGAIISGTLVGLDMRTYRDQDWLKPAMNFYSAADGIFLDTVKGKSGTSFWYDVLPNVLFFQVADLYPNDPALDTRISPIAQRWSEVCVALAGAGSSESLPNFDHTGFNLRSMKPFDNGERIEPEGAAGVAWLEYMAWVKSKDAHFLAAAEESLRALEKKSIAASPLYEVLLPYAALTAARMNAELGREYDVSRLINWCFEPRPIPQARPNWGVLTGSWNNLDVDGLVGSATDGGGYAFAMNSFQYVGTLAPLARYDPRYAHDLGKWILNVANAARLFYGNAHDAEHQSSYAWSSAYDSNSVIAYEGLRKWKRSATSVALGDCGAAAGKVVQGSFASTQYYQEDPPQVEVLEETVARNEASLDHTWNFDLPDCAERFLVVAAERVDRGHHGNAFAFSYATNANGPFTEAFRVGGGDSAHVQELPASWRGKLYVKAASAKAVPGQTACDQLLVDAMAISFRSNIGPYAQGDLIVSFIDLVKDYTVPIVLYRPETVVTDLDFTAARMWAI